MLLTAEQYFESRRKHHHDHIQGEHAWLGDVSTSLPELSCYNPHVVPWYHDRGMGDAACDCAHDHDHGIHAMLAPMHADGMSCQGSN